MYKSAAIAILIGIFMACLFGILHDEDVQDLAGLTQRQRSEVVSRWGK